MSSEQRHKRKGIHRKKSGLPPGTPIYTGAKKHEIITLQRFAYDTDTIEEINCKAGDKIDLIPREGKVLWVNINGLHQEALIEEIAATFKLHNLVLEDILNVFQIPKAEEYPDSDQIYIALNEFYFAAEGKLERDQISIILGNDYVLSFQEEEGDYFELIRDRLRNAKGKLRKKSGDYLVYVLIDSVVDSYYVVLDHYATELDSIENDIFEKKNRNHLERIHQLNKDLIYLRRSIAPLKEVLFKLLKEDVILINPESKLFLRDVLDHVHQVVNQIDVDREYLADLVQTNMANMNAHLNEIIKVLTLISTIFIPLTFIVGVYGMNFGNIPLMQTTYGYFVVWGVMIFITLLQFFIFKRKKWL
ncbi:MAG TPA: magnesium/cobalt transporter CorA [Chitinophagales bacterium]|nr:magnesium/cobalt transporter CorA [Chitinophagales bacterium]HNA58565.1 magnesium/cobalt transporter CorA [Chitinophagales bacterium]HNE45041.1 magnesium/cobalt transporter CorA [Chitinophagales bacterium]HNI53721.1 magnesium/cobalt transporter CorA [Chitinophagales bacterium]HNJ90023.1 magnesium/cobalt transporter CorA [Chitinophagales bacterium]